MKQLFSLTLALVVATFLGACASSSPDVIQRGDAQRLAHVEDGVVLSVRSVVVDGSQSGVGAGQARPRPHSPRHARAGDGRTGAGAWLRTGAEP